MKSLSTTKMSSKGQIVIPESIRKMLKLHEGDQFVVMAKNDVVILKVVTPPSIKDLDNLIREARIQARQAKIQKSDILAAIKKARE